MRYQPDHYRLLGVPATADLPTIKESYRRLSRVYHPDRQGGSRAATVRFQQIAGAWAELSDPQRRERYDRLLLLRDPLRFVGDPRAARALDALDEVVTRLRRRRRGLPRAARGRDLRVRHTITWQRAALGGVVSVPAHYRTTCPTCRGEGTAEPARNPTCHICGGQGRVKSGLRREVLACGFCDGRGVVLLAPCGACAGKGEVQERRTVPLEVPPRCRDGAVLRLRGAGETSLFGGADGDLVVELSVAPHPLFERDGDDVICPLPLTWTEALAGGTVTVPTLEGSETLRLPVGLRPGQEIRIAGRGLPRGGARGDLRYRVFVDAPTGLDRGRAAAVHEAVAGVDSKAFERRAAFDRVARRAGTDTLGEDLLRDVAGGADGHAGR